MSIHKTVSFSGYRPEKLPDFGDETAFSIETLKSDLHDAILQAISHGFDTFLVGMAEGFDMYATESVIEFKSTHPNIKLIAIVPFEDGRTHTERYENIIKSADDTVALADEYTRGSYYARNEYMVDNSTLLICYYDGRIGGTEYTVDYANKKGVQVINLAPKDMEVLKTFDNVTEIVRDDLERTIKKDSKISIAAACFSIYAYDELKRRLKSVKELRFVFTSPTFTTDKIPKSKREFYIPRLSRERSLYGMVSAAMSLATIMKIQQCKLSKGIYQAMDIVSFEEVVTLLKRNGVNIVCNDSIFENKGANIYEEGTL